jgi:hypothetical protein
MTAAPVWESIVLPQEMQLGNSAMSHNRKAMLARAGAAAMALGLSGCIIPFNRTIVHGVETRLVDARTGAGVAGARVSVSPSDYSRTGAAPHTAISATDGSVKIKPIKQLMFVMPAMDVFTFPGIMRVEADGYEPYESEVWMQYGSSPASPGPTTRLTPRMAPKSK